MGLGGYYTSHRRSKYHTLYVCKEWKETEKKGKGTHGKGRNVGKGKKKGERKEIIQIQRTRTRTQTSLCTALPSSTLERL